MKPTRGWDGGVIIRKASSGIDEETSKKSKPQEDPSTLNMTKLGSVKGKNKEKEVKNTQSASSSSSPSKQSKQKSNKGNSSSSSSDNDTTGKKSSGDKSSDKQPIAISPMKKSDRSDPKTPPRHQNSNGAVWPVANKANQIKNPEPKPQKAPAAPRSWASLVSGKTSNPQPPPPPPPSSSSTVPIKGNPPLAPPSPWKATSNRTNNESNDRNEVRNALTHIVDQAVSSQPQQSSSKTSTAPRQSPWSGRDRDAGSNNSTSSSTTSTSSTSTSSKSPPRSKGGSIGAGWKVMDSEEEVIERRKSSDIAKAAAEAERDRRIAEHNLSREEEVQGRRKNQDFAITAMEGERHRRMEEDFLIEIEAASERTERKEWASRQLAQEYIMQEKERRRNQDRLHDQLSQDILDFNLKLKRCMVPRRRSRAYVVGAIEVIIKDLWPQGAIKLYGSSYTGIDIPSSDVDMVVYGVGTASSPYIRHEQKTATSSSSTLSSSQAEAANLNAVTAAYLSSKDISNVSMVNKSGGGNIIRIRKPPMLAEETMTVSHVLVKDGVVIAEEENDRLGNNIEKIDSSSSSSSVVDNNDNKKENEGIRTDINNHENKGSNKNNKHSNNQSNKNDNKDEKIVRSSSDGSDKGGGGGVNTEKSKEVDSASSIARETMEHVLNTVCEQSSMSAPINSLQRLSLELSKQNWVVSIKSIEATSIPVIKLLVDPKKCSQEFIKHHPNYIKQPSQDVSKNKDNSASEEDDTTTPTQGDDEGESGGEPTSKKGPIEDDMQWGGHLLPDGLLQVDISFEGSGHGGIRSSEFVRELLHVRYPEAIPLVLVIKELLAQRHLNEPFTGGLSSYALVLMVVAIVQMWQLDPKNKMKTIDENVANGGFHQEARAFAKWHNHVTNNNGEVNMGALLTKFFAYFGREFDIQRVGLSITRQPPGPFPLPSKDENGLPPHLIRKTSNNNNQDVSNGPLITSTSPYIEDPLSFPSRNVAHSAFRFGQAIQFLFSNKVTELEIQGVGMLHRANSPSAKSHKHSNKKLGEVNVLRGIVLQY
jgi:hypothetical protein